MKTLVLIRHAKSSWKFSKLKDKDRPLKERGLVEAPLIGKVLKTLDIVPDIILTSPAVRAITTAKMIAKEVGLADEQIIAVKNLYFESMFKLLQEISKIDDMYNTVFLVGHNPGLTELANEMTRKSIKNIPTSGAFGIQFESETWAQVKNSIGENHFFEFPKKHRE